VHEAGQKMGRCGWWFAAEDSKVRQAS